MRLSLVLFGFVLLHSCTKDIGKPVQVCNTPETVSFSKDLIPLFNQNCNTAGCHSGNAPAAGLNLEPATAYSQLLKKSAGYVDTVHPQFSVLYSQMSSASTPMPPTGNLDQCKLDIVMKWIQQKAKNN